MRNQFKKLNNKNYLRIFAKSNLFKYIEFLTRKILQSIRVRLMLVVLLSVFFTFVSILFVDIIFFSHSISKDDKDLYQLDKELSRLVLEIRRSTDERSIGDLKKIQELVDKKIKYTTLKVNNVNLYIIDTNGKVILSSETLPKIWEDNSYIVKDAINSGLRRTGKISRNYYNYEEVVFIERIDFNDSKAYYVVMEGVSKFNLTSASRDNNLIHFLVGTLVFILSFFLLTKREVEYIEELTLGVAEITKGNLDYRVKEKTSDELGLLATKINYMSGELKVRIEEERKAEKSKNELITNMSHDLRTPLTSIMGYLRMLKDKKYEDNSQLEEYVDIAYNKSEKLKTLIDDLFLYSKLANEDTILYNQKLCLNDMLGQLIEELTPLADEKGMTFIRDMPNERIMVVVDADKLVRVFENLISNAIKYGYSPGEVKIKMSSDDANVRVDITNKGDNIPQEELPKLFDRLYMVDKSRSSSENGSGLGLAISKSIVNLHKGKIWAQCEENNLSFCIELPYNRVVS